MDDNTWEAWQEKVPTGGFTPVQGEVGAGSVFLFTSSTSPLPWASHFGYWQWFDGPADLVDYLRCVGLPDACDEWFDRRRLDDTVPRVDARQVLAWAQETQFRPEDVPLCAQVLDLLDAAASAGDDGQALALAAQACQTFTDRFGRTPWWDLTLAVYPSVPAAAERVFADEGVELPADEWRALAAAAVAGDADSAAAVAEAFRDAEYL